MYYLEFRTKIALTLH